MFRTYKDGKLYVSPQNGGLYDAIFNEGQKGIVEYERAMSQPSPIYGKWPEPKPDFIDNVLATGKAIGYELLQTGPRVYDLGQITAGYVSLRFFDKDLDVKLISDIGRATQSGNFSTEGREFKVGFSLYAGLGGGAELTFIPDSNSFFGIKVKEFDADLGVGLGVKFGSRWQPKTMMGPNTPQGEFGYATTLPRMEGYWLGENTKQKDGTIGVGLKATADFQAGPLTVTAGNYRAGWQSTLNSVRSGSLPNQPYTSGYNYAKYETNVIYGTGLGFTVKGGLNFGYKAQ